MIRKGLVAITILMVGLGLGWVSQGGGTSWRAFAQPPRGVLPTQQPDPGLGAPFPGGGIQPVPPLNIPAQTNFGIPLDAGTANFPAQGVTFPDGFVAMTAEEAINVSVYDRANRSVVNIATRSIRPEAFLMNSEIEGNGSGSVFDQQGHILTNYHVIAGAKDINVTLFNGDAFPAELVGQDPDNDIAVLQIAAPESLLFPLPWGDSSTLKVGQHIIAIGNPFGLERTMSTGIISSLNRQIPAKTGRTIRSIIQIDAALNQGNSGGPLLSSRGELIGMNTAIATRSGDNAGIGFSIPVNTIRRVVPQLLATGRVLRPTIGIMQVFETEKGLLVVNLTSNGPAEKAGVKGSRLERKKVRRGVLVLEQESIDHSQSDLIVAIDGQKVRQSDDLLSVIETKKSGDQVVLSVMRSGQLVQIPVILGNSE